MLKLSLLVSTMAIASATGASATTIIFDNQSAHPGGTLIFGTSSGNASLADGVIDQVTNLTNMATFQVSGTCGTGSYGCLNFTTGSFLDSSVTGSTTSYRYAAGGSLSITGSADGGSGNLYSSVGFAAPVTLNVNSVTGLSSLSGSISTGTLNAALAASLGLNPHTIGGTDTNSAFNIVFTGTTGRGSATTNSVQIAASPAPEPSSVILLGVGFIALANVRRKRTSL